MKQTFSDDSDVARDDFGVTLGVCDGVTAPVVPSSKMEERQNVAENVGARPKLFAFKLMWKG